MLITKALAPFSVVALLLQPLFFASMGILGMEYQGIEESNAYLGYVVVVFLANLLAYLYATVKRGLLKGEAFVILVLIIILAVHALWVMFEPDETPLTNPYQMLFFAIGIPGFFAAATVLKLGIQQQFMKVLEVAVVFIVLGVFFYAALPTLGGLQVRSLGGASYQFLSYVSAFMFGILFFYSNRVSRYNRFAVFANPIYYLISHALMLICVLGVFYGGGRGAFVLLIAYLGLALFTMLRNSSITHRELSKLALRFAVMIVAAVVFFVVFFDGSIVQAGYRRATAFIGEGGTIDLVHGSSGRDRVYARAIEGILASPILGYGPFTVRDKVVLPHNIFFETTLQFGFIGLLFLMSTGVALLRKAIRNWNEYTHLIVVLMLYPMVMLQFSGSYMTSSVFWFGVTWLAMMRIERDPRPSKRAEDFT